MGLNQADALVFLKRQNTMQHPGAGSAEQAFVHFTSWLAGWALALAAAAAVAEPFGLLLLSQPLGPASFQTVPAGTVAAAGRQRRAPPSAGEWSARVLAGQRQAELPRRLAPAENFPLHGG